MKCRTNLITVKENKQKATNVENTEKQQNYQFLTTPDNS